MQGAVKSLSFTTLISKHSDAFRLNRLCDFCALHLTETSDKWKTSFFPSEFHLIVVYCNSALFDAATQESSISEVIVFYSCTGNKDKT